jgi:hypothetical protein
MMCGDVCIIKDHVIVISASDGRRKAVERDTLHDVAVPAEYLQEHHFVHATASK